MPKSCIEEVSLINFEGKYHCLLIVYDYWLLYSTHLGCLGILDEDLIKRELKYYENMIIHSFEQENKEENN